MGIKKGRNKWKESPSDEEGRYCAPFGINSDSVHISIPENGLSLIAVVIVTYLQQVTGTNIIVEKLKRFELNLSSN